MKDLNYRIVTVTPMQQNCTVLWCTHSNKAAVVDPGGDLARIEEVIDVQNLQAEIILVTHGHVDHCGMALQLSERLQVPIEGPQAEDAFWLQAIEEQGRLFGLPGVRSFTPQRWLEEGDQVAVGNLQLQVIHCPGHTPGHVVFYYPPEQLALVGDVLFNGSIGRTDFPRGDFGQLMNSIRNKLLPLGDEVQFISGHGPISTFGEERFSNPYVVADIA